jgi:D-galactarolactone cycloisomerase
VKRGFRAMKMRIGRFEPARDLKAARAVREAVGPAVKLMADANEAYTLPTALKVGRELEKLDFYWYEEPIPRPDLSGYDVLIQKLRIAVAGGEGVESRRMAQTFVTPRRVDILQPDPIMCGGIAECLFIAELAHLHSIACHPHNWAGALSIAAALHVCALLPPATWGNMPELPLLEFDVAENPFRDQLIKQPFEPRDGFVAVPKGPGLGVEVDEAVVRRYRVK